MTRMTIDCRTIPSDLGCTVSLHGEPEELLDLAARHAVDTHGHIDGPELREGLRTAMTESWQPPTTPGAFVQLIEFATDHIEEWTPIQERLVKALGPDRPMRWSVLGRDRDQPDTYLALVEFPSHEAATANSADPATHAWFTDLSAVCRSRPTFRNLDVQRVRPY
jgi:quinol monooxygenase YgiN